MKSRWTGQTGNCNLPLISAAFFLLATISTGCGPEPEKIKPTVENISESAYAPGIVKSKNQYQVFSAVNGIVKEVLVVEGDLVKKGQTILRLTNTVSTLMKENARLAAEYADLGANADKLNELRLNIELTHSKMINDSLLWVRQENLRKQNVGTLVEWEQRKLAYQNSVTTWRAAALRYRDMERQLKFAARQSAKSLEISATQTNDYTLVSEVDGKVYQLLKKTGEMVTIQAPVAVLGEVDHFILELQVDENDIARIIPGQTVLVTMDSYAHEVFEATVDRIYPMMNERTQSFLVEAEFVKRPPTLYPNLTAEANIIIMTRKNALTIPRLYLIHDSLVMKEDGRMYKVETGLKDYQKVEILNGLTAEEVILKPEL